MKNKKILLLLWSILIIISVIGFEINFFQDSSTSKNLTFTGSGFEVINLSIPLNANVTNATFILTGYNGTEICNQENVTNLGTSGLGRCGLDNGSLVGESSNSCTNGFQATDGNYSTFATTATGNCGFYINYSKPIDFNSSSWSVNWTVKDTDTNPYDLNFPDSCLNRSNLMLRTTALDFSNTVKWRCYNGSDWYLIRESPSTKKIYEESIKWITGKYPNNITILTLNDSTYKNLSEFNSSSLINLNITSLKRCVNNQKIKEGGNVICPINVSSESAGILQLSNLNITYQIIEGSIFFNDTSKWNGNYETDDTVTRVFYINSTKIVNQTNCNINVSLVSLRNKMTVSEYNFTIENQSQKQVNVSFVNPSAFDYSAFGAVLWGQCGQNATGNIDIEFVVTTATTTTTTGGGGGGGGTTTVTGDCELELFRPRAGSPIIIFGGTVNQNSNPVQFDIRNIGEGTGTITYKIEENDFLEQNCFFVNDSIDVRANLVESNFITCKIPSKPQEGVIVISGCQEEGTYQLFVAQNKLRAFFSGLIQGDIGVLFGGQIFSPQIVLIAILSIFIFIIPLFVFIIKKIFG